MNSLEAIAFIGLSFVVVFALFPAMFRVNPVRVFLHVVNSKFFRNCLWFALFAIVLLLTIEFVTGSWPVAFNRWFGALVAPVLFGYLVSTLLESSKLKRLEN